MPDMDGRSAYGHAVLVSDNYAAVGAPFSEEGAGSVSLYMHSGEGGAWEEGGKMVAFDGTQGTGFGYTIGMGADGLWVGAPGASNGVGSIYAFEFEFCIKYVDGCYQSSFF